MAIEIEGLSLTYYPVPKSGTSSVKYALMALGGKAAALSDPDNDVHDHLSTNWVDPFSPVYDGLGGKFTIVRDPLERLLSAYSSRIVDADVLTRSSAKTQKLKEFGLPTDPDFETFVSNVDKYSACSWEIEFHIASPRHFLGSSLFLFEHVFRFEEIDKVGAFLSSVSGKAIEMPRLQAARARLTPTDLSPVALAKAMRFCRYDYGFLVDYYDPTKWGGIPDGDPGETSSLHVLRDPTADRDGRLVYPRTLRNLIDFVARRPLQSRIGR
ncbi:sulfotransferase family protein [Mesorhizobium sp. CU2]|uniref:sulfotransferase family 2 domain-containing protein n=1 Tax=unclassified Mesorhizobium TaxID=325217 RepID=UPI00112C07CF|nr:MULTISPECIES: sulfotransferase family 2 domain-containing protein [unclassified Mesorhizobium]TPN74915.1 sulfotransferase family protein [Mesorhizobium sp. CU3]TPO02725.1 sulfotransferase family protein [Mesorhizobium sp. CU2]